jgi:hypothetical protein
LWEIFGRIGSGKKSGNDDSDNDAFPDAMATAVNRCFPLVEQERHPPSCVKSWIIGAAAGPPSSSGAFKSAWRPPSSMPSPLMDYGIFANDIAVLILRPPIAVTTVATTAYTSVPFPGCGQSMNFE